MGVYLRSYNDLMRSHTLSAYPGTKHLSRCFIYISSFKLPLRRQFLHSFDSKQDYEWMQELLRL